MDTIQTTVFAQSLSNCTCTFTMMRGGTLLILGNKVKGQGQLWHYAYKTLWTLYRLQFLPNHFQTSHVSGGWLEKKPCWFRVTGSKVKVLFCTLCIRSYGHNTDHIFFSNQFQTSHVGYGWWGGNPIDFWSWGHRSRSTLPPCEGMPRFALSSWLCDHYENI